MLQKMVGKKVGVVARMKPESSKKNIGSSNFSVLNYKNSLM